MMISPHDADLYSVSCSTNTHFVFVVWSGFSGALGGFWGFWGFWGFFRAFLGVVVWSEGKSYFRYGRKGGVTECMSFLAFLFGREFKRQSHIKSPSS
jgi:hypothetical protein